MTAISNESPSSCAVRERRPCHMNTAISHDQRQPEVALGVGATSGGVWRARATSAGWSHERETDRRRTGVAPGGY